MKPLFKIQRFLHEVTSTIGMWKIDETFFCWTLEDEERQIKVMNETAIPCGVYEIALEISPKFGLVPTIRNVPNFTSIRVHAGNTDADTSGCVLVGTQLITPNRIQNCAPALDAIIDKLKAVGGKSLISIEQYVGEMPIQ